MIAFHHKKKFTFQFDQNQLTGWMTELMPAAKNGNVTPSLRDLPLKGKENLQPVQRFYFLTFQNALLVSIIDHSN